MALGRTHLTRNHTQLMKHQFLLPISTHPQAVLHMYFCSFCNSEYLGLIWNDEEQRKKLSNLKNSHLLPVKCGVDNTTV